MHVGICTSLRSNVGEGGGPTGQNPLDWALKSLVAQDRTVDRVLVMKHGDASPAFHDLIGRFADRLPISVESWSRSEPLGRLRNRLLELAGDDLLFFLDDDAILSESSALSRQVAALAAADDQVAVLQAPVLRRSVRPRRVSAGHANVGRIHWQAGVVSFRFDSVLDGDEAQATLQPVLPLDHLCLAQCLVDAPLLRAVGGFTTFPWPAVYGQESELAVRIRQAGHRLIYLPDPQAAVVHLKFGAPHWTGTRFDARQLPGGVSFGDAARLAAVRECGDGSWSRKSSAGFFADFVSGFGAVFAHGGQETLARFLSNVARWLVDDNAIRHPFVLPIDDRAERAEALLQGIRRLEAGGLLVPDRDWALVASGIREGADRPPAEELWI